MDDYLVKSAQVLVSRDASIAGLPGAENTNEQGTDGSKPGLLITFLSAICKISHRHCIDHS